MAALCHFFAQVYTITIFFFTLLMLELIIFLRSITVTISDSSSGDQPMITTAQYLKLIEEKSPSSRYNPRLRIESKECTVCLSMFEEGEEIRTLTCNHIFHKDCLDKWLEQDWATCPLCRNRVLPEEVVEKYRQQRYDHHLHGGEYYYGYYMRRFL